MGGGTAPLRPVAANVCVDGGSKAGRTSGMTERRFVPRVLVIVLCTALQICFGTVYAWSFFQSLLVNQLGWSFMETAAAFSIAIFSLGMSAAWAGAMLPRLGPRSWR